MFDFQSSLIFPTHAVPPAGPLPAGAERLSIATPDGSTLAGIHILPDTASKEKAVLLGFGGNAWNAQDVAEYLHGIFPDVDVVVFHYRGYSPSSGIASGEALIADAPLVYDLAVARLSPKRIIAVGFSIGSAVAATLARSRKLDGLILVTPFDSLKALAQGMYPWLPIGPFFEHQIDAAAVLEKSQVPVAIIAAGADEIVYADRTDALRKRVKHIVFDRTIPSAGHNDIYARSEFQEAMREALTTLSSSAEA